MAGLTHHGSGADTQHAKRLACDDRRNCFRGGLLPHHRFGNWWLFFHHGSLFGWCTNPREQTKLACVFSRVAFGLRFACFTPTLGIQGSLRFLCCLHSLKLFRCGWCRCFLLNGLAQQVGLLHGRLLNRSRTDFHLLWCRNRKSCSRIFGLQVLGQLLDYLGVLGLDTLELHRHTVIFFDNSLHQTINSLDALTHLFGLLLPRQRLLLLEQLCVCVGFLHHVAVVFRERLFQFGLALVTQCLNFLSGLLFSLYTDGLLLIGLRFGFRIEHLLTLTGGTTLLDTHLLLGTCFTRSLCLRFRRSRLAGRLLSGYLLDGCYWLSTQTTDSTSTATHTNTTNGRLTCGCANTLHQCLGRIDFTHGQVLCELTATFFYRFAQAFAQRAFTGTSQYTGYTLLTCQGFFQGFRTG